MGLGDGGRESRGLRAMIKKSLYLLFLLPILLTYGSMYSMNQHWSGGYFSHRYRDRDHVQALCWAISPPAWVAALFVTRGYKDGLQFKHHHTRFCEDGYSFDPFGVNHCEGKCSDN